MKSFNLALVGCGRMGSALLAGCLDKVASVHVIDPAGIPPRFAANPKISHYPNIETFNKKPPVLDILVFAVKPQNMSEACKSLAPSLKDDVLLVSIAAGKTIASFEKYFGTDQPIIRVMPNTPASIGRGISVAVPNAAAVDKHKKLAAAVFLSTGILEWTDDESLMDAVTAVSGSGPAYVFLLIELLARAGEKQGLPSDLAMKLARETVIGSAALAESEKDTPVATLRANVTSPGGTTAAALQSLNDNDIQKIFDDAIKAATKRGKELSA